MTVALAGLLSVGSACASAAAAPSIESESASNITATDATLEAQINPNGLETTYEVKLEAPACEGGACESTGGVQIASGTIPAGSSAQTISVDIAQAWGHELSPKVRYGYSVNASNSAGQTFGNFKVFETPGARPSIESESASNITATDATLEAQINPNGLETTYEVKLEAPWCGFLGPGSCESTGGVQIASGTIPAGSSAQTISVDIAQVWHPLSPNTSYGYSVNASNSTGQTFGNLKDFETPAASPPSIDSESASNLTQTDATLEAEINPESGARGVYYQFQLVKEASEYATEILCPPTLNPGIDGCIGPQGANALPIGWVPGNLANPLAAQPVQLDLASAGVTLEPSTTYHFRVIAARAVQTEDTIQWEPPTVYGGDQTFTTASSGVKAPAPCVDSSCPGFGGTPPPPRTIRDCARASARGRSRASSAV